MSKMLRFKTQADFAKHIAKGSAAQPARELFVPAVPAVVEQSRHADGAEGWPTFEAMLRASKLPLPVYEYRFHPTRKWRFDMAWPAHGIAIEVDGGAWSGGRHTSGQGFTNDLEKINAAILAGWRVLRYTPERLAAAIDDLKALGMAS